MVSCRSYLSDIHDEVRPHLPEGAKVSDASVSKWDDGAYTFRFGDYEEMVTAHCGYCAKVAGWNNWLEEQEYKKNKLPEQPKKGIVKQMKKGELIDTVVLYGHNRSFEWKIYAQAAGDSNLVACTAHCEPMKAKVLSSKFSDVISDIRAYMRNLEKKVAKEGATLKQYLTETCGMKPLLKERG